MVSACDSQESCQSADGAGKRHGTDYNGLYIDCRIAGCVLTFTHDADLISVFTVLEVDIHQNGQQQSGWKKSAAADVHISLTKNLNAIVKQLLELVPPAQKNSKLQELMGR